MKLESLSLAMIAAVLATSCANEELVDVNPDVQGNALHFSPMVGHSRAIETTVNNLGDFAVVAKGIHPHGGVYTSYLIGGAKAGEKATKEGNSTWTLENSVYWPSSMENVVFWAYTTSRVVGTATTPILPNGVEFGFNESGTTPSISNFTPLKADLSGADVAGQWNDGADQTDLLVSFVQQSRTTSASNVNLNFDHALSQITIKAQSKDKLASDHRIVRIKGAWVVNTNNKAVLSAGFEWDDDAKKATSNNKWTGSIDGFSAYGSFFKEPILLDNATQNVTLLGSESSLMLVPQKLEKWNKESKPTGAYILLLCRVELRHSGTAHSGSASLDDIEIYEGNHYHQQFPVNANQLYDASEYGFVCVPIESNWEMGKRYEYTLDICGAATGAGIYPPDFSSEETDKLIPSDKEFSNPLGGDSKSLVFGKRPVAPEGSKKEVGDPVLDAPIQFTVAVKEWIDAEGEEWKPGVELR